MSARGSDGGPRAGDTRNAAGPSRARKALFALVTIAGLLFAIEAATRLLLPTPWIVPRRPAEDPFLVPHPIRGYAFRRSFTNEWRSADYAVQVRLNELGLRDGPLAEAQAGRLRILALGDSYTFGIGVEGDQNWPAILEERLQNDLPTDAHPVVFDAGVPGYSARQARKLAEELIPQLKPQIVIFGMYMNSYWRVENPYMIFDQTLIASDQIGAMAVGESNELLITAFPPGLLRTLDLWLKQHLYVAAHFLALANEGRHWPERPAPDDSLEGIERSYGPVVAEIDVLDRLVQRAGARLIVVPVNAQEGDGTFSDHQPIYNAILREHCLARAILFVDPLPVMIAKANGQPLFRFPGDAHWTVAAHALTAELLERTILGRVLPDLRAAGRAQFVSGSGDASPPAGK
jgi:hypothetical protein